MELTYLAGVVLATVVALISTERARRIVRAIFRRPTKRSIVLTIDGDTLVIDDATPEQQNQLLDEFLRRHSSAQSVEIAGTSAGDAETLPGGEHRE